MKPIKAVDKFTLNGVYYEENDIVEVKNIDDLIRLNEKGLIEPLTPKDLQEFNKEESKPKKIKIEEE